MKCGALRWRGARIERRAPSIATSKWWKEERHGVFVDYNQNAKDRTTAAAYSVRPTADARVSAPLSWDEVDSCEPADFTLATMPSRFARLGDRHEGIDADSGSLERLLELSARHEREGLGDAPWPPQYKKQPGEPPRVQPSRRRVSKHPLIEIGRAQGKADALAGLERWKVRHAKSRASRTGVLAIHAWPSRDGRASRQSAAVPSHSPAGRSRSIGSGPDAMLAIA